MLKHFTLNIKIISYWSTHLALKGQNKSTRGKAPRNRSESYSSPEKGGICFSPKYNVHHILLYTSSKMLCTHPEMFFSCDALFDFQYMLLLYQF